MSLINDALKRAREAQQHAPTPEVPAPQLRAEDPERHTRHNLVLLVPAGLALLALAGLIFVWQVSRRHADADVPQVAAKTPPGDQPVASPTPTPPVPPSHVPETHPSSTATDAGSATVPTNSQVATPVENPKPASESAPSAPAVAVVAPEPPPAKPPPKLQGIVFNPRRPSALIDGKTLFIGDRFGEFTLIKLTANTATLAGKGVTNVLSLPE